MMSTALSTVDRFVGAAEPRLWTPPLRELTPETSYGFDAIEFSKEVLGRHPYPWQEWLLVHAGELLPDGRPRFRQVLVLVSRQNGKTEVPVMLSAYWMFVEGVPLVLGTSTKVEYAKESWTKLVELVEHADGLDHLRDLKRWKRETNGEQECWTLPHEETGIRSRYKIAASNAEGGRSLTIHRLVLDELRQHKTYEAWDASVPATDAVDDAQIWALSNAGDDNSIVLNELREQCLDFIKTGVGDPRVGLFEWSAEEDADPEDPHALLQANPSTGHSGMDMETLLSQARTAVRTGGEKLTGFKTEKMCIRVRLQNPAIDPGAWKRCLSTGDMYALRGRLACAIDVAPDGEHATLMSAGVLDDGKVRVAVVEAWEGPGCTDQLRRDLPALLDRVKPKVLGWLPNGPAAALAADLTDRRKQGKYGWPPRGIEVAEVRGEVSAVCMGFAEQVTAERVAHSADPLLDAHVGAAERLKRGDAWVFSRKGGAGHVDAAYAAAAAVHLARTMPPPLSKPNLVVVTD